MNLLNKEIERISLELVEGYEYINIDELLPHEEILEDRLEGLLEYINSLNPYIVVPSILVCADSNLIIDGHHRYYALKHLNKSLVPVTRLKYDSENIITGLPNTQILTKNEIIKTAYDRQMLKPKSTAHHFVVNGINLPLILLSQLMLVK